MKNVIIIGASGHGKVVADIVQRSGDRIIGFLDDNTDMPKTFIGLPVLGSTDQYREYKDVAEFVIAVGNAMVRKRISEILTDVRWYTAIHPSANLSSVGSDITTGIPIGEGTVIMANAVVNSGSKIGKHCIINTGAVVEHDNELQDFVHVSVGAKLGGTVCVGKGTWIGIGSCVKNNITICEECMIGAGAVVVKDIDVVGTYVGVPAERVRMNRVERHFHGGG